MSEEEKKTKTLETEDIDFDADDLIGGIIGTVVLGVFLLVSLLAVGGLYDNGFSIGIVLAWGFISLITFGVVMSNYKGIALVLGILLVVGLFIGSFITIIFLTG